MVERGPLVPEVTGSNPVSPAKSRSGNTGGRPVYPRDSSKAELAAYNRAGGWFESPSRDLFYATIANDARLPYLDVPRGRV